MKKTLFKYFDMFYYGELSNGGNDENLLKPVNRGGHNPFGYHNGVLYCNGYSFDTAEKMFSISKSEYKSFLKEWFEQKYPLIVEQTY